MFTLGAVLSQSRLSCGRQLVLVHCQRCASSQAKERRRQELLDRIIRVDHAGELGANRIYQGQMAVLGNSPVGPVIQHMWDQEKEHLKKFEELIPKHRVRPTVMLPLWNVAGFVLGASTALLGKEGAMACTTAVETAIVKHYNDQIRELIEEDPEEYKEMLDTLKKFRDEEQEHHDTGIDFEAEKAPLYNVLYQTIKWGCTGAIWVSERI
ncbi:5-demethoxyubiquinone hydroxylase, mitochondrial [Lingula anatina]|uniref:5-demethoxyubiquinone hydroxylase, mitochondrial n=1 Tax=Lingula anatina TaxID=7574 RepID=A0A1S3HLI6_LINAN|nr:5-demethoxyubiquinone hydroxylase, mitochondrial [Lingula anatina]|eukprot:XP_013386887.1 5-demethoxyubiquinone hydroxylase, mitochondrial [Lingula anatina]